MSQACKICKKVPFSKNSVFSVLETYLICNVWLVNKLKPLLERSDATVELSWWCSFFYQYLVMYIFSGFQIVKQHPFTIVKALKERNICKFQCLYWNSPLINNKKNYCCDFSIHIRSYDSDVMLHWMTEDTKCLVKCISADDLSNKARYLKVVMLLC